MNILFLAPHPFYQERGTPIATHLLLQVLAERGDQVDVVTYHEGVDKTYEGPGRIRIFRISPPPGCRGIRPGFSLKKLVADISLRRLAHRLSRERRYDVIHASEEAVFIAMEIARRSPIPIIYDMDSSMPDQITDKLPLLKPFLPLMRWFETKAIRRASAVAAVCEHLGTMARRMGAQQVYLLRDAPILSEEKKPSSTPRLSLRQEFDLKGITLLYVGNLEFYQGIDLMLDSFALIPAEIEASLVVVGGTAKQVNHYQHLIKKMPVQNRICFAGHRPLAELGDLIQEADILVSPRTRGTNTPMKIYSYMASGRAILATDLPTHTQVLDHQSACLAPPEKRAFSKAMQQLILEPDRRARLASRAKQVVETQYSRAEFRRTVHELFDQVASQLGRVILLFFMLSVKVSECFCRPCFEWPACLV